MKKIYFFAALAAVALASCSNDEVVQSAQTSPDNAIAFRTLMGNVTRAADQTQTTLQESGKGFFVTAMYKATSQATATQYFDNVQFTYDNTSKTYNSVKKYYWPATGTLDFFAYAPEIPTTSPQVSRTNHTTFVVTPSTTVSEQVDLIYANTDAKEKTGAYTPTGGSASTYGAAGVPLNFRHTGSKIVVKVKNSESNNLKFEITGMKIVNVDGSATFTYNDAAASAGDENTDTKDSKQLLVGDWGNNADSRIASYKVEWTTANVINTQQTEAKFLNSQNSSELSATTDENINMILIPQHTEAVASTTYETATENAVYKKSYIALKLKIYNIGGTTETPVETVIADATQDVSDVNKWAMWPVEFQWEPGKKYTYTIDLANGGYWEINDDADADLDPILDNALIKFVDVTVDNWADATGIDVDGPTL
ncbi:MAG: fimbrillin family protein [Prevotella sp.]|nr:fimbrillin family protein [Prevotella sp.]